LQTWRTPTVLSPQAARGTGQDPAKRLAQGHTLNLMGEVGWYREAAPWQTPVADDAMDRAKGKVNSRGEPKLSGQVMAAPWPTATAKDATSGPGRAASAEGGPNLRTAATWTTPAAGLHNDGEDPENFRARQEALRAKGTNGNGAGAPLPIIAKETATWPTATSSDAKMSGALGYGGQQFMTLTDAANVSTWVTPSARDWKDGPGMATTGVNPDGSIRNRVDQLPRQVAATEPTGPITSGSPERTEKRGALNPEFVCWLMGYPPEWDACAPTAMRSCRKSRPK
jgi:hypothetical protein